MKRLAKAICMVLVLFIATAFTIERKPILLILTDVNNKDTFSIFEIRKVNGVLIGQNEDEQDYPIKRGIYRIHGSSNDKYYNKNILIVN